MGASRKQRVYCEMLAYGLLKLRGICSGADDEVWWGLHGREQADLGFEVANLLHHVPGSVLEPDFVDDDLRFINIAFHAYVERVGEAVTQDEARLMTEFYD